MNGYQERKIYFYGVHFNGTTRVCIGTWYPYLSEKVEFSLNAAVDDERLDWYLNLLKECIPGLEITIADKKKLKAEVKRGASFDAQVAHQTYVKENPPKEVIFSFVAGAKGRQQLILVVTLARTISEYPQVVVDLYKEKEKVTPANMMEMLSITGEYHKKRDIQETVAEYWGLFYGENHWPRVGFNRVKGMKMKTIKDVFLSYAADVSLQYSFGPVFFDGFKV